MRADMSIHFKQLTVVSILAALFLTVGTLCVPSVASATTPSASRTTPPPATTGVVVLTAGDLDAFLDGLLPQQLAFNDIAGAVVCVVKDGQVLLQKGYGFADLARKVRVSPETSLFRAGSISKLVTWTAVMQLAEQGRLDLDADVNKYLDFSIPATFDRPVTLRHLMTHTAGFEECVKDLLIDASAQPLGAFLPTHLPRRVAPPGERPSYSNYGAGLAGYIVQRVSGMPFEDYVEQFVFRPLSMGHSTFRQPVPATLIPLLSNPYSRASVPTKSFEVVQPGPAGAMSSSASDMSRLMLAHLQGGSVGTGRILRPETMALMHARAFGVSPLVNGMALGFYEQHRNGRRIIGHGGDTKAFHSDLHLMLDEGVGLFVSYNSAGLNRAGGRPDLWQAFLDRYFPAVSPPVQPSDAQKVDLSDYVGRYVSSRRSDDSLIALFGTVSQTRVFVQSDGTLGVKTITGPNGVPRRFVPRGRDAFIEVDGQEGLAFKRQASGRMAFQWGRWPVMIYERVSWWESQAWAAMVGGYFFLVIAGVLVMWPIAGVVRRRCGLPPNLDATSRRLRLWTRLISAGELIVVMTWLGIVMYGSSHLTLLVTPLDPVLRGLQALTVAVALSTCAVLVNAGRSFASPAAGWGRRSVDSALALAALGFLWMVLHFNMLDFSLRY
jgi:CubicO group peptidase (beta-lactamase class C family)